MLTPRAPPASGSVFGVRGPGKAGPAQDATSVFALNSLVTSLIQRRGRCILNFAAWGQW